VGVDQRLLKAILDQSDAPAEVLRFARAPREGHRIDLDPVLVDLFRYYKSPEAIEFFVDAVRRWPEDVDDGLVEAVMPLGEKAVDPLINLYEELGEEKGADVAFLLAGLRVREPRVLTLLLDRLEYDAADGAFCLGLYGDPGARPALERMLSEIPEKEAELRREISHAIGEIDAPEPAYVPESFDILAEYPKHRLPPFHVLPESERLDMFASDDPEVRAGAAHSFFNNGLHPKSRSALLALAQSDPEPKVRGRAWEALADAASDDTKDASIRNAMIAVLNDASRPIDERGGAAVGLYAVDRDEVRRSIEGLYEEGGKARVKALEAMWRSLWEPYASHFPPHLDETDPAILREAIRGTGYFRLTRYADKIAAFFDREDPYDDLREDALFAYALAMPGETTRGRVRGMLRKIDSIARLTPNETDLVMLALDERLRLHGLEPVFQAEEAGEPEPEPEPPAPPRKIGRNDPCPCGSGKKYKKCHGVR
jgi:hypothetical protein